MCEGENDEGQKCKWEIKMSWREEERMGKRRGGIHATFHSKAHNTSKPIHEHPTHSHTHTQALGRAS